MNSMFILEVLRSEYSVNFDKEMIMKAFHAEIVVIKIFHCLSEIEPWEEI